MKKSSILGHYFRASFARREALVAAVRLEARVVVKNRKNIFACGKNSLSAIFL
jgi:hypothetical protein